MSASRILSIADVQTETRRVDVPRLRLTLQNDLDPVRRDQSMPKPVGQAYVVLPARNRREELSKRAQDPLAKETTRVRSMYELDVRGVESETQESSLDRLRMELAHFKEVRHSMEKIRDHLSVGMNEVRFNTADYCSTSETDGREGEQETEQMRRATQRLYGKLKEAEARHERESRVLEQQANQYSSELRESRKALWQSEEKVSLQDKQIEELQRLVARMEKEHQILVGRMQEREKQLEEMRAQNRDDEAHRHRSVQLEREVETLREKISHLGDMQQSQQRKVRQMIEQLQASRKQIEEKDLLIQQLQERVDCLESENRELQDHVEHLNCSKSTQQRSLPERSAQVQDGLSNRFPMGVKKPKALMRVLETQ